MCYLLAMRPKTTAKVVGAMTSSEGFPAWMSPLSTRLPFCHSRLHSAPSSLLTGLMWFNLLGSYNVKSK